jgi:hypothetical protein
MVVDLVVLKAGGWVGMKADSWVAYLVKQRAAE